MRNIPTFVDTIGTLCRGYLPKVFQARGWVLVSLIAIPFIVAQLVMLFDGAPNPEQIALVLYHQGYAAAMLPIIAMVSAPACISEDLEQRTLPLILVRPAPAWALPIGKGLLWFVWCSIWLVTIVSLMPLVGLELASVPQKILALVLVLWAQLGFVSLLVILFKQGVLWSCLIFFIWDPLIGSLPETLQRFTFTHYLHSLAGSQYSTGNTIDLLAQTQIRSPIWLSVVVLFAIGLLTWGLCGLKLLHTPIGLAGRESEG